MAASLQNQAGADLRRTSTTSTSSSSEKNSNRNSSEGVILGGGLRGAIGFLSSTLKIKMMVYKRAFLAIGEQTMDKGNSLSSPTPGRWAHSRILVYTQSTLMGMVVFGTYDGLVYAWHQHRRWKAGPGPEQMDGASIGVHAIAGAASGVTRSLFWIGWERLVYDIPHSWTFSWRSTVHHACGHGVLFGSYYCLRTFSLEMPPQTKLLGDREKDNHEDFFPLLATFVAGGIAGQLHHITQHYTSHWRQFRFLHQRPPPPRFQPVMASFVPMGLCFAVFEYGGESAEEIVSQLQQIL